MAHTKSSEKNLLQKLIVVVFIAWQQSQDIPFTEIRPIRTRNVTRNKSKQTCHRRDASTRGDGGDGGGGNGVVLVVVTGNSTRVRILTSVSRKLKLIVNGFFSSGLLRFYQRALVPYARGRILRSDIHLFTLNIWI